jgi:hypothetical protein
VIRDTDSIPYRKTQAYARAAAAAALQKAAMHHRVGQLWPSQAGQSTSGAVRRRWFGYAA